MRKKIVHVTQSMSKGGAEMLILGLAVRCAEKNDVTVVCQYPEIDAAIEQRLRKAGVKIILLNKTPGFSVSAATQLWGVLSEIKPDVVHTHIQSGLYAIPWYIFHKKCVRVHTIHTMPSMEFTRVHMFFQRLAYKHLGLVPVAIGKTVARLTAEMYGIAPEKIPIITNGIDVSGFRCGDKDDSVFNCICVANFSKWKNQGMLIRAMTYLGEEYHLRLLGGGDMLEACKSLAEELGVSDRVHFFGRVDNTEDYLATSDVFALSSTFEGIPLSVIEAYASGLPVVSTNVGSISDIVVDGKNGFLVGLNDYEAMANVIRALHDDRERYNTIKETNLSASQKYDIASIADSYDRLYEELMNR